jgi:hypothetical protein
MSISGSPSRSSPERGARGARFVAEARGSAHSPDATALPEVDAVEPALDWSVNPWRENARTAVAAIASSVLLAAIVATARLPLMVAVVLAIAGVAMMAPGFATTRCRVDAAGVSRRLGGLWWDRRPWERIRLAQWARAGVLVSPERAPGTWAALRGLFLPLPPAERSRELRDELRRRMDRRGL